MIEKQEFQRKIGNQIRELRTSKRLSQAKLGAICFKDKQLIGKAERGEFNPTGFFLYEIATALGVKVGELFEGIYESKPSN